MTCREVLPIVHGLEKEYQDRITFVRVNILQDHNLPMMDQYGFSTTPEFYLVDEEDQIIGFWNEDVTASDLRAAFDQALDPQPASGNSR
jgi:hypothetical protein